MKRIYTLLSVFLLFAAQNAFSQLKINEFDYEQPGPDSAEYIELYNGGANAEALGDYQILLINGNNNTVYDTIILPTVSLNPGAFFVICGNGGYVPNCDMQMPVLSNIIQNGSPDAIAIVTVAGGNVIDAVSYEGSVAPPYVEGTGIPNAASDTSLENLVSINRFPDGADSDNNSADFVTGCGTPGAANTNVAINCATAVREVAVSSRMTIYPNPSKGISLVDFNGNKVKNATVTVNNVIGKEVKRMQLKNNESMFQLDLSEFDNGVYFVKVKSDSGESTQRILLKK